MRFIITCIVAFLGLFIIKLTEGTLHVSYVYLLGYFIGIVVTLVNVILTKNE